mmetsp:Transcript_17959/g.56318  ORF Transcript_17959/g.56318 Transcript_17959/m.56318 type:complete len:214 (-) Transcript_17959:462-1103(-)
MKARGAQGLARGSGGSSEPRLERWAQPRGCEFLGGGRRSIRHSLERAARPQSNGGFGPRRGERRGGGASGRAGLEAPEIGWLLEARCGGGGRAAGHLRAESLELFLAEVVVAGDLELAAKVCEVGVLGVGGEGLLGVFVLDDDGLSERYGLSLREAANDARVVGDFFAGPDGVRPFVCGHRDRLLIRDARGVEARLEGGREVVRPLRERGVRR